MYKIRKAKIGDVSKIHKLVNYYAEKRIMLPRSLSELYERLQDFFVVEFNGNEIVGCCALGIVWDNLAEIKSLAVMKKHTNKGLGKKLVYRCQNEAKKLGIKKIFVLTYIPKFFIKLGFKKISKDDLPHKIWSECIQCPFFPDCKEEPLLKTL